MIYDIIYIYYVYVSVICLQLFLSCIYQYLPRLDMNHFYGSCGLSLGCPASRVTREVKIPWNWWVLPHDIFKKKTKRFNEIHPQSIFSEVNSTFSTVVFLVFWIKRSEKNMGVSGATGCSGWSEWCRSPGRSTSSCGSAQRDRTVRSRSIRDIGVWMIPLGSIDINGWVVTSKKWDGWCSQTEKKTSYPLVNSHIAMENHHFSWENPLFLWSFSIAMLNYQRVYKSNYVASEQDRCCKPSTASAHPEETWPWRTVSSLSRSVMGLRHLVSPL